MKKIILFSILLVSVFILAACATLGSVPVEEPESVDVSLFVNATLTAIVPPPSYTPTPPLESSPTPEPTATSTEVPTATPTATLPPIEGDPATLLGEPNGVDNFDTFNNWSSFDNKCFKSEITGTQYKITAKGLAGIACWEVSWPLLENFYIETMVEMPQTCQPTDRFGMLFRAPDNDRGYLFGYTCDAQFTLTAWDGNENTAVLVPLTASSAINPAPGAKNRMGFLVQGADTYLYANGLFLAQTQDVRYLEPGKIGYYVRAADRSSLHDGLRLFESMGARGRCLSAPSDPATLAASFNRNTGTQCSHRIDHREFECAQRSRVAIPYFGCG